jgi:hypothetical protein
MYAMDHLEPHRKMERMGVELDEIYGDDASLRAELERRIGTVVVAISIKHIDYVRETMLLGVEYIPRSVPSPSLMGNSRQAVSVE